MARRLLITLLLALALVALPGCRRFYPPAVFDLDSVNVASVPEAWPAEFELTPGQQEVYDERGAPDFLRARWDPRGTLMWGEELRMTYRRQRIVDIMHTRHRHGEPMPFDLSWIYQEEGQSRIRREPDEIFRGEEVVFVSDAEWEMIPVTDMLGTIIDCGDPEMRRAPDTWNDRVVDHWVYYKEGRIFHFIDGDLSEVERVAPMPVRVSPEI